MVILLFCILSGLTFGNFLGSVLESVPVLDALNYQQNFGLLEPVEINLGFLIFAFRFEISISLLGVVGMLLGVGAFRKWV